MDIRCVRNSVKSRTNHLLPKGGGGGYDTLGTMSASPFEWMWVVWVFALSTCWFISWSSFILWTLQFRSLTSQALNFTTHQRPVHSFCVTLVSRERALARGRFRVRALDLGFSLRYTIITKKIKFRKSDWHRGYVLPRPKAGRWSSSSHGNQWILRGKDLTSYPFPQNLLYIAH